MGSISYLFTDEHEGRAESVTRSLLGMIEIGVFSEGEQLPSEIALAAQLGVASVTLREALTSLRSQGIIETRRGRNGGSFIRARQAASDEELREEFSRVNMSELGDYAEEHIAVSGAAAQLAANRASIDQHAVLDRLIIELGSAQGFKKQRQLDARFHIEVAIAARSVRLARSEARLQAELGELLWLPYRNTFDIHEMQMEHLAILEAIIARDATLAGALAQEHVRRESGRLMDMKLTQLIENTRLSGN